MMKSSVFVFAFFVALSTLAIAAPALSVSYAEGSACLRSGSSWQALSIGDSVPAEAIIRLDDGASVQLKGMGADIWLAQKGTYAVHDLLAARQKIGSPTIGNVLSASLAFLLTGPAHNQSAVLGARGADESKGADSDWVETTAQENIQQGKDYLK
ncbi:MAG: hypothetical protein ABSG21_12030 [Spirochaetia bacterium]|jgi:hypothetical protein